MMSESYYHRPRELFTMDHPTQQFTICGCGARGPLIDILRQHQTPEKSRCDIDQHSKQG